jgi:hypothetical protein
MMTDEQILCWAASMKYMYVVIDSSCCIRYGRDQWETRLPELTAKQKMTLQGKIDRCEARLAKERAQSC